MALEQFAALGQLDPLGNRFVSLEFHIAFSF